MPMKYKKGGGTGGDAPPSVHLDMAPYRGYGGKRGGGGCGIRTDGSASFFEPWPEQTPGSAASGSGSGTTSSGGRDPPEKRLTLFALRLAVLEKAACGLGKLAFAWATVVLLGGFASDLKIVDFWFVTTILMGQGARVFSRSHELEWQQHATSTSTAGGALRSSSRFFRYVMAHGLRSVVDPAGAVAGPPDSRDGRAALFQRQVVTLIKQRTWHAPEVSLIPYTGWVFVSRKIGRLLHWLQVLSALTCVALSLIRLCKHDFVDVDNKNSEPDSKNNMRPSLLLFYALSLLEASLFLLEKAYSTWKLTFCRLLREVSDQCDLREYGPVSLTRFFYDAYSRCIAGSIFDGIKMDLVSFAEELIQSDFLDEQLIGAYILERFASSERSAHDTVRKLGTSHRSMERLVEMLNWKQQDEKEVRRCAAVVVSKLASRSQNMLRVSGIPGAIESVMSLLSTTPDHSSSSDHYDYLPFNLLGLEILKKLARDHDNCGKVGNTRGLLAGIVSFTHASPELLRNPYASEGQVRAVKSALKVVKMLVSTTGNTGKELRKEVAENVFSVCNLRGILQHGQQHRNMQKLATDVLTGLAMDEEGKEAIVGTGGLVKLLLDMFFSSAEEETLALGCEAGEALAMLALESRRGCAAILKSRRDVLDQLMAALHDARCLNAARLLRNLCAYSGAEHRDRLRATTRAMPAVLKATMTESDKVLEVSVGLTTEICRLIDDDGGGERFGAELRAAGVEDERAYVKRLASVLDRYANPEITVPRMRRFLVQQLIWLMTSGGGHYVDLMREVGMERLLKNVADTTSELECYHVFSGSVGISKHREDFSGIVEHAMESLAGRSAAGAQG